MAIDTVKHSPLSKAKARLLMDQPFFATLLLRTELLVSDTIGGAPCPTAATDGNHIVFNPEFLEELTVEEVMFVLCHEVGHDALLHSIRLGARNPEVWNEAADHAINLTLLDQGMKMPAKVPGLADPKYKGMSADRIYDDLRRNPPKGGGGKAGAPGGAGGQPGNKLAGDVRPNPAKDSASQAQAENRAKQKIASAANMARMAGKLKGELARMVGDILEPKIDWTDVLRDKLSQIVKERDNWGRRNRRFSGIYLPTRRSMKMGPMYFIPDTSGSMWGDDMEKICSEMGHCAAQAQPESVNVLWADTEVRGEQVFTADEFSFAALEPKGGGGTDMRVPLAYVEEYDPLVVVLMTDGFTPWPELPPPYELIVLCTTDQPVPFGEVIRI